MVRGVCGAPACASDAYGWRVGAYLPTSSVYTRRSYAPHSSHRITIYPPTQAKEALDKKLNRPEVKRMDLSEYERMIAEEVLDPEQLEGGFDTIGGLEQAKREVCMCAIERIVVWLY